MYKVTAYFKDHKITKSFYDMYDAIDFKDNVDAHYPSKINFERVLDMREFVYNSWEGVMNHNVNPLKHIPDLQVRHVVLQILAWMWCIIFSMYIGSWAVMGVSMVAHALVLAGIVLTVGTFEIAKSNPSFFLRNDGYHSTSRTRQHMWINGEKVKLDKHDPGGEHE
tara:strand:- start:9223 stop:9720 length:498 start_codon:yes stop_codon:yes gene_type:complete